MIQKILFFGAIAGGIVASVLFGMTVAMANRPPAMGIGALIGYSSMLVALSTIFVAVKRHRDRDLGGVIKFLPAFLLGLGISTVAGVFYVLAWEAALAVTGMDFAGEYAKHMIEQKQAAGVSAAELAKYQAEAAKFQAQYANLAFRMPMTFLEIFPVGVLVSVVSAGLLRNSRFLPARA